MEAVYFIRTRYKILETHLLGQRRGKAEGLHTSYKCTIMMQVLTVLM
jgi:hypothetical protein